MNDNLKWVELKATLQFVEEKILRITEINGWVSTKELHEQVKDLLRDRHNILNQMFQLHINEDEIKRFLEVNNHLLKLSQEMFIEHRKMVEFLTVNFFEGVTPGSSVEVESCLDVDEGCTPYLFKEDADYGSDFGKMADAIIEGRQGEQNAPEEAEETAGEVE